MHGHFISAHAIVVGTVGVGSTMVQGVKKSNIHYRITRDSLCTPGQVYCHRMPSLHGSICKCMRPFAGLPCCRFLGVSQSTLFHLDDP
jgi:hypothetical protein